MHDAHIRSRDHLIQAWINVRILENWCACGGKLDKSALRQEAAREISGACGHAPCNMRIP